MTIAAIQIHHCRLHRREKRMRLCEKKKTKILKKIRSKAPQDSTIFKKSFENRIHKYWNHQEIDSICGFWQIFLRFSLKSIASEANGKIFHAISKEGGETILYFRIIVLLLINIG